MPSSIRRGLVALALPSNRRATSRPPPQDRYERDLQDFVDKKAEADAETQSILEKGEEAMRRKIAATQLQKIIVEMYLTVQGYQATLDPKKKK